jgi:hypothetical protein
MGMVIFLFKMGTTFFAAYRKMKYFRLLLASVFCADATVVCCLGSGASVVGVLLKRSSYAHGMRPRLDMRS